MGDMKGKNPKQPFDRHGLGVLRRMRRCVLIQQQGWSVKRYLFFKTKGEASGSEASSQDGN